MASFMIQSNQEVTVSSLLLVGSLGGVVEFYCTAVRAHPQLTCRLLQPLSPPKRNGMRQVEDVIQCATVCLCVV